MPGPELAPPGDELFRCPLSGAPLRREDDAFVSPDGRRWPIVRGIPRFVADDRYVDSFSFEWNVHKTTQLDSSNDRRVRSEQALRDKTGLTPADVRDKLVLDAGVGAGRFSEVLAEWGARVVGVDLSFAVEASHENLARFPHARVAQADIFQLPFAPATFDLIVSVGVLHHTPSTLGAFQALVPLLKPGGTIAIWVYPAQDLYLVRDAWIPFTRRLPKQLFYRFCRRFVGLSHTLEANPFMRYVSWKFPYSRQFLGEENDVLDTFDGFSPTFHGIHSLEEVRGWFTAAGLVDVVDFPDWPTAVRGRKPE